MDTIIVHNIDDLLNLGIEKFIENKQKIIFSDDLNLGIKVSGESWNGVVDYRIATFVVELQEQILNIYNRETGSSISLKQLKSSGQFLKVDVSISEGCLDAKILFSQFLNIVREKVSGGQITFVLSLAIFVFGLIYGCDKFLEYQNKNLNTQLMKELLNNNKELSEKIVPCISDISKAFIHLSKMANSNDTIKINNRSFSGQELRGALKATSQDEGEGVQPSESFYLDGQYGLALIDIDRDRIKVRSKDGQTLPASLESLSEEDRRAICEECSKAVVARTPAPKKDLWLTLTICGDAKAVSIVGVGVKPRSGSMSFQEATNRYSAKIPEGRRQIVQASLMSMLQPDSE